MSYGKKIRIVIVGIGGVGGYFGGLLAKKYSGGDTVELCFVARGEHLQQIREIGLKVVHGASKFVVRPDRAVEKTVSLGIADYILLCTKNFDLENALAGLAPNIGPNTVLLPLLNGVDAPERISRIYPGATVWKGCVYIIARLMTAGVVENLGNIQQFHFGLDVRTDERPQLFHDILKDAGIEVTLTDEIETAIWEKYIFISSVATATSFFDRSIGELLLKNEQTLIKLIREVRQVALTKKVEIDPDIETKVLEKLRSLPFENTSSMHSDFKNKRQQTELEALTGYVVKEGATLGIPAPTYKALYNGLKNSP